jgi:hypothetical protein
MTGFQSIKPMEVQPVATILNSTPYCIPDTTTSQGPDASGEAYILPVEGTPTPFVFGSPGKEGIVSTPASKEYVCVCPSSVHDKVCLSSDKPYVSQSSKGARIVSEKEDPVYVEGTTKPGTCYSNTGYSPIPYVQSS